MQDIASVAFSVIFSLYFRFSLTFVEDCFGRIIIEPDVVKLSSIRHCTVLVGSLHVANLGNDCCTNSECALPNLVEILGSLVVEQSTCLTDLSLFLPNLTVIRGWTHLLESHHFQHETKFNYSIVVRNTRLAGVGLSRLMILGIPRVLLANNPFLCFVSTIDWVVIGQQSHSSGHLQSVGSGPEIRWIGLKHFCLEECPYDCQRTASNREVNPNCWSSSICQKTCSRLCLEDGRACYWNSPEQCCHPECDGACTGPGPDACVACKHALFINQCVSNCPPGYLLLFSHRCVSYEVCVNMNISLYKNFSISNGTCVSDCATGYIRSKQGQCIPCTGGICYSQVCGNLHVYQMEDLEQVRGCETAQSLLVGLTECNDDSAVKMMAAFADLKEIHGSLHIIGSNSLRTLGFMQNLQVLRGTHSNGTGVQADSETVLEIAWNDRLAQLWRPSHANRIRILNGRLVFTLNRKLCPEYIIRFVDSYLELNRNLTMLELDLIERSNGDASVCSVHTLNVSVAVVGQRDAQLGFDMPDWDDPRQMLPVTVYYRIVTLEYVNVLDEAVCDHKWFIREPTCTFGLAPENTIGLPNKTSLYGLPRTYCHVEHLRPATWYKLFVEIRSVANREGALSDRFNVFTYPDTPSTPTNVRTFSVDYDKINLQWNPPIEPNGQLTEYRVWYRAVPLDLSLYSDRASTTCLTEPVLHSPIVSTVRSESPSNLSSDAFAAVLSCTMCAHLCHSGSAPPNQALLDQVTLDTASEASQLEMILFEDRLQNLLLSPRSSESTGYRARVSRSDVVNGGYK
ncbi:hypothetical protein EG68_07867 [Paragonimus skrjabini miyazakii]|uniref:receptor protein-tyrosine kinase n=1 Tax=Paragonimus skrjabini miyazakii TaxID=59628 RepID=A0A8S9YW02_9TREM|nr:hypothetical protein EG68_07867 [Paragonimus skrjabini miyazakii]